MSLSRGLRRGRRQATVDSDANGHVGRTELISAADDLTATLQMPKSWMHNGLRSTLHRLAAHIGHRCAVVE
jgi:hypothetical protein